MNTYAVLAACTRRDYQFLAPLTALLWRDRIQATPIVMVVGNWAETVRGRVALEALRLLGIRTEFITPVAEYEEGRTAQQCREMIGCLDLAAEDFAWPTDADLWPVLKSYYHDHLEVGKVTSLYSNGDHYQTLPTCSVQAQVKKWRQMYDVKAGDDITAAVQRHCDEWLPKSRVRWPTWGDGFALWMMDQFVISEKVFALPEGYIKVERRGHPPVDRIDRGNWQPLTDSIVDAHLLRPADQPEHWPRVRELFGKLVPQHLSWADEYQAAYVKGYCNA